jgi:two-component system LytT family sensor kinase
MVAWESIRPAVSGIYTSDDLDFFLQKLQYPWAKPATGHSPAYSLSDLRLPATNNNLVFVLNADIYSKNQIQYQLIHDDRVVRDWRDNEFDNSFIWLKDFSPGQYRIRIRYAVQPRHVTEYSFEVEPAWYQSFWLKLVIFFTAAVVIGLIVFASLLVRQRRKTHREAAGRQKLQLELKALYAQLNPHFVFNALSSIQGLINLQDLKGANEYLSDFARLMRESLNRSGKEETSLEQELNTMKTYLKLEQLRFGFLYSIHVDEQIDVSATSLPPLLWQPLLENAVKHGVAPFQQTGQITIRFNKTGNDLDLKITDTGKGKGIKETSNGFGLKLTRDRIQLLNELNNQQHISMSFKQLLPSGTEVSLTFTNWFL